MEKLRSPAALTVQGHWCSSSATPWIAVSHSGGHKWVAIWLWYFPWLIKKYGLGKTVYKIYRWLHQTIRKLLVGIAPFLEREAELAGNVVGIGRILIICIGVFSRGVHGRLFRLLYRFHRSALLSFFAPSPGPSNHSPNLSDPWEWGLFTDCPKIISVYMAFIPQDHPMAPQGPFKLSYFGS